MVKSSFGYDWEDKLNLTIVVRRSGGKLLSRCHTCEQTVRYFELRNVSSSVIIPFSPVLCRLILSVAIALLLQVDRDEVTR